MIFGTDFEENDGGFITGVTDGTNNPWEWGIPTSGPMEAASGENLWATNLSGSYTSSTDAYIESPAIYLPADKESVLTFTHWVDMEGTSTLYDYGQVLISSDNGATWTNITPVNEANTAAVYRHGLTKKYLYLHIRDRKLAEILLPFRCFCAARWLVYR